jgi:hypothetical protein
VLTPKIHATARPGQHRRHASIARSTAFQWRTAPTHALLTGSPAIAGNNLKAFGDNQRGSPYAWVSPLNGSPDIGAFELQQNDAVFDTGFDGCP